VEAAGTPLKVDSHRTNNWFVLVVLCLCIFISRLYSFHETLERDITTYAVIGHELLKGRNLYSDIWDNKPPAAFVTFALAELIAGYGPNAVFLINVLGAVLVLFGVYVVGATGLGDKRAGLWAAAFWMVISGNLALQANQPNTELMINACLIWAFALLLRADGDSGLGRFVLMGALLALASLYKITAIIPAVFLSGVYFLWPPPRVARWKNALPQMLILAVTCAFIWLLVMIYFSSTGRLNLFWETMVTVNQYLSGSVLENIRGGLTLNGIIPSFMIAVFPLYGLTILGMIYGAVKADRAWIFLMVFLISSILHALLPGWIMNHYYQLLLPALAVGGGWVIGQLYHLKWRNSTKIAGYAGLLIFALLLGRQLPNYFIPLSEWPALKYGYHISELFTSAERLGQGLAQQVDPRETIYEYGFETGIYYSSKISPSSAMFYINPTFINSPIGEKMIERIVNDLERNPPKVFIYQSDLRVHPAVIGWINQKHCYHSASRKKGQGPFRLLVRVDK